MSEPNDNRREGAEDDEDEEELDEAGYKTIKDAVLFAIDVSESMLSAAPKSDSKREDQVTPTAAALKCAYALMQQRIISNPHDMMGVLLFGTKETKFRDGKDNHHFQHCYLLADLDVPAAADVKRLKALVEDDEEAQKVLVPSGDGAAIDSVLFCANQVFTTKAPNFSSRRLFVVTDNDDPHAQNKELRSLATVRAKDLYDLGVFVELFPISRPGHDFDRSKFYDDIVYRNFPSDPEAPSPLGTTAKAVSAVDGLTLLQSLLNEINSKNTPRRALFSNIPLEFDPSFKISVRGYIIFKRQEAARSCYVWMDGEKPQIAIGTTTRMSSDTARTVQKNEIKKAFKFGGDSVLFTPEELSSIRNFGDPVIRILGFKPISMLPLWANLKTSTFIYPSEEEYVGSTRTFSALQQAMLKKEKMALVWYIARRNAAPVIAALLPGPEKLGETGEQVLPPGMWIVPLPFRDDIRSDPETSLQPVAPEVLIDRMRDVIKQLTLPRGVYEPSKYPNPALQWHYRILQAMALEEDLPEKAEDKTIPRYKQIHKRAGPYVIAWGEELGHQYQKWQQENAAQSSATKRAADDKGATSSSKKIKALEGGISDDKMREHVDKGSLSKLTVSDLKDWAKRKGISVGNAKKPELMEVVERHFEDKMVLD